MGILTLQSVAIHYAIDRFWFSSSVLRIKRPHKLSAAIINTIFFIIKISIVKVSYF